MGNVSGIWGLITIAITVLVTSLCWWSQWPDRNEWALNYAPKIMKEYAERCGLLVVMVETLLKASDDTIKTLLPRVDTDSEIDNTLSQLLWARGYVMSRLNELGESIEIDIDNPKQETLEF